MWTGQRLYYVTVFVSQGMFAREYPPARVILSEGGCAAAVETRAKRRATEGRISGEHKAPSYVRTATPSPLSSLREHSCDRRILGGST